MYPATGVHFPFFLTILVLYSCNILNQIEKLYVQFMLNNNPKQVQI